MQNRRPFTEWMADKAEETLIKNDVFRPGHGKKPPWETVPIGDLRDKLDEEFMEFIEAYHNWIVRPSDENREKLQLESADVAVTVMMMADNVDPEMSRLRRGR